MGARLDDGVATWTGGRIEGTDVVSFPLEVTARTEPGNETFRAVQRYDDGESVRWEASLTVVPATGAMRRRSSSGAPSPPAP